MEILIEWGEYTRDTRIQEVMLYNRGDVITYKPDGWGWSRFELACPKWRIFRIGLTEAECESLIAPELDLEGTKMLTRKRKRKLRSDTATISQLPQSLQDYLADETRAVPIFDVPNAWRNQIRNMEYIKPDADTGQE